MIAWPAALPQYGIWEGGVLGFMLVAIREGRRLQVAKIWGFEEAAHFAR
jgi:hypothetical protein